jgi:predicted SprT family Zn-dependent metalloprotease
MNLVSSDKLSGLKSREELRCRCGAQPTLVRKMMDPQNGKTVRMFECQCGERLWTEHKE